MRKKIEWCDEMADPVRKPQARDMALGFMDDADAIAHLTGDFSPGPEEQVNCRCTIETAQKPHWWRWQFTYAVVLVIVEILVTLFGDR